MGVVIWRIGRFPVLQYSDTPCSGGLGEADSGELADGFRDDFRAGVFAEADREDLAAGLPDVVVVERRAKANVFQPKHFFAGREPYLGRAVCFKSESNKFHIARTVITVSIGPAVPTGCKIHAKGRGESPNDSGDVTPVSVA